MQLKIASVLAAATLSAGVLFGTPAQAASLHVNLDGRPLATDVAPLLIGGRTMVPVRPLFEALGASVEWDAATARVTGRRGSTVVTLQVGSQAATVNGDTLGLDVAPLIVEGRTMVPVRFISESLGARVGFDASTETVYVDSRGGAAGVGRGEARPLGQQIAATAKGFVGYPYAWGGTTPGGFDCSGFAQYIYGRFGISIPRSSYDQFAGGTPVSRANLQPGDLVFFSTYADGASHVGIYLGDGQFVSAQSSSTGVTIRDLNSAYWGSRYLGARRYR